MIPELIPVESSNVVAIGYGLESGIVIEFKSGATYRYPMGTQDRFDEIMAAESKGKAVSEFIRSPLAQKFERIDGTHAESDQTTGAER